MIGGFFFMGLCCFGITITVLFQVGSRLTPLLLLAQIFLKDEMVLESEF